MLLAFEIWMGIITSLLVINVLIASVLTPSKKAPLKKRVIQIPPPAVHKKAA